MRIPGLSRAKASPFKDLEDLAGKIKQCTWAFQQALECLISKKCESFEELRQDVVRLVSETQAMKNQIQANISKNNGLPVKAFQYLTFLGELTKTTVAVEQSLEWFSYRREPVIPPDLEKDFFLLFDSVVDPVEELFKIVSESRKYFKKRTDKQLALVVKLINGLSVMEQNANKIEDKVKRKIFSATEDPLSVFHLVRFAELIASISDHAGNSGDVMRGMLLKD